MKRHSLLSSLAWLWMPCRFQVDGGEGGGTATPPADPAASTTTQQTTASAADIQARIDAALAAQQAQFSADLEQATGHKDLKALTEANLKAQGKLQELADNSAKEAQAFKSKFQQSAINNALLNASAEAVDPAVVAQLLAGQCQCDDDGKVTIGGKPVADAVKALLADKPFLAKAQGGTGSGAGQSTGGGKTLSRAEFEVLDPSARQQFFRDGGKLI